MTSKADFTAEEWLQLLQAPMITGVVISMASPAVGGWAAAMLLMSMAFKVPALPGRPVVPAWR